MAGSSAWRAPLPLLRDLSHSLRASCRGSQHHGPRAALAKSYVTARERQHAKAMERYYNDIIRDPRKSAPPEGGPRPTNDETHSKTERQEIVDRARVVFGSRLAGPVERRRELELTSKRIAGVLVPPRPDEPDNCCMSGCVNCVWDRYRDELEEWAEKSAEARTALQTQRREEKADRAKSKSSTKSRSQQAQSDLPEHVMSSMDDDGGGSEALWTGTDADRLPDTGKNSYDDLFAGVPVGIREFMKTEKRLREMKQKDNKPKQKAVS